MGYYRYDGVCNAGVVVGYDRRIPWLCNVATNSKYDNYRTEK